MSRGVRARVASGVYQDAIGLAATVKVGRIQKEKRFPLDTDLVEIKTWQKRTRGDLLIKQPLEAVPADRRSSFTRDVVRFLRTRKGLPSYKADRSHLAAWVERFPKKLRALIKPDDVRLALAHWRLNGQRRQYQTIARPISRRTLRHRLRVLRELYHALDGNKATTPVDDVDWPTIPKTIPRDVDLKTIKQVAAKMETRWPLDHARLLVLATTGRRPAEVMRTVPADLDFRRKRWTVQTAKGGEPTLLYLNDEMIAAWKRLINRQGLGTFDTGQYAKHLRKCGWPPGVRPYNVRHALAHAILREGGDLSDVQVHLGHSSIDTTRTFYAGIIAERAKQTSQALRGRFASLRASGSLTTRDNSGLKMTAADKARSRRNRKQKAAKSLRK